MNGTVLLWCAMFRTWCQFFKTVCCWFHF